MAKSNTKYYEVFVPSSGFMTIHIAKSSAIEERKYMQEQGSTGVCIKLKHRTSRISDYHKSKG